MQMYFQEQKKGLPYLTALYFFMKTNYLAF